MKYRILPIIRIRLLVYALGMFALFVGAYVWYLKLFNRKSVNTEAALQREEARWILVYIGSPTCGPSRTYPENKGKSGKRALHAARPKHVFVVSHEGASRSGVARDGTSLRA